MYLSAFRIRFISGLQYRAAAWAGISTQFFFGFVLIMVFRAFYAASAADPPLPWPQLVSYLWLQQAFLAIFAIWRHDGELMAGITDGLIAYELCRPFDLYTMWYVRLISTRLSSVLLRCFPILAVTAVLPERYRLSPPADAGALALFALSLVLALLLVCSIYMFIYIISFYTMNRGVEGLTAFAEFLQGSVIPIPLMPLWAQRLLDWLPFRYYADLPLRLYSGNIAGVDALRQIGIEMLWTAVLLILGSYAFRRATKRVVIQGG